MIISRLFSLTVAALCVISLTATASAQAGATKPAVSTEKPAAPRRSTKPLADPLLEARRQMATTLVINLADEARSFRSGMLAARVQARAADALWEVDNERARALFRRAWEAADTADRENLRRAEEQRRAQQAATGSYAQAGTPNLRAEVLRLAARRDRALGEEFLAKLDEAKKQDDASGAARNETALSRLDPSRPTQSMQQRLQLAQSLLQSDETERAVEFADPVLERPSMQGLSFLSRLREKNAKAADERYAAMLARAVLDPQSDANTVSLLASYVFTPHLFITVDPEGSVNSSRFNQEVPPPDVPQLKSAYLRAAAQILLRPLPPADQDPTTSGRTGIYFVIARLLPLFDRFAPDRAPALRAQLAALAQSVSDELRNGKNEWLTEGLVPDEEQPTDELKGALEEAERETNPERRNSAYATAALAAARKGDVRARDYADKIEDTEMRKSARAYVDYELLAAALKRKDAQEAARLARTGELTNIQRVWGYTEAAGLLTKSDPARATELLEEAATEARRIGGTDAERVRALVAVATQMFEISRQRGWELMSEVVKASNSAEGFTGEDGRIVARFSSKNSTSLSTSSNPAFDLAGIFAALARDDMNRAVELAKGFDTEAPRAAATLAIARTILNEKRK